MPSYKIKPCGLTSTDLSAFTSMLKLSRDNLHHQWEIVSQGDANLYVYCLDYQTGITAWEKRIKGLSCLLVPTSSSVTADIALRKPLRVKNFSEALNSLDDKLSTLTLQKEPIKTTSETTTNQSPSFRSSLSVLSNRISKPHHTEAPSPEPGTNLAPVAEANNEAYPGDLPYYFIG